MEILHQHFGTLQTDLKENALLVVTLHWCLLQPHSGYCQNGYLIIFKKLII